MTAKVTSLDVVVANREGLHPEQNGAHERMYRTLKPKAARPPDQTIKRQQEHFDEFRDVSDNERPHETLARVERLASTVAALVDGLKVRDGAC